MKLIILLFTLISAASASDFEKVPKSFKFQNSLAVFSDFTNAEYYISYDMRNKRASVDAIIKLVTFENGHLVFDLHNEPNMISIDGELVTSSVHKSPNNETSFRILSKEIEAGEHILKMTVPLTQLVEWEKLNVKSAFWMSDLTDRGYIERYIPTNMIFDRFPMTFYVKFLGHKEKQNVYANGVQEVLQDGTIKISYREDFNTTCQYFHTVPESSVLENKFTYNSVDGRVIPVIVYVQKSTFNGKKILERTKTNILRIMRELETDYGPFLHPDLTVYVAGSGGMEYSGATMTSESALGHELFHSYFARGVMPSNGNAGWVDEALASWRDEGYQSISGLAGSSRMAAHGYYQRASDRNAYTFGERFISYLDGLVKDQGGLKPFLRSLVDNNSFKPHTTEEFIELMNRYYQKNFNSVFDKYIYGKKSKDLFLDKPLHNHIHRQLSLDELQKLL